MELPLQAIQAKAVIEEVHPITDLAQEGCIGLGKLHPETLSQEAQLLLGQGREGIDAVGLRSYMREMTILAHARRTAPCGDALE